MKKNILLLFLVLIGISQITRSQIREIPMAVTEALLERYPHAEKVAWKDKLTCFQAQFQLNNHTMTANFSSMGEWQCCECIIDFNQLPSSVKDGFSKSKYADWQKMSVTEIQKMGNPLQYKILVQKGALQKKGIFFDVNGVLQKEQLKF